MPPSGRGASRAPDQGRGRPASNDYPAIELAPGRPYDRIREFYLYVEPSLLAAIARGDRVEAVRLINHVLLHIYAAGEERSDLLKGLLLELVVMMSRAAVEAGSSQTEVLGRNFRSLTELAGVQDDEELARWLRAMLERVFTAMERTQPVAQSGVITDAIRYVRENAHRELTRDETARAVGVSPSHFSHLVHERTGLSFTVLLRQARIELACDLLMNTDEPLASIAQRCGFYDQSHFTKVFARARRVTPRQFREQSRAPHRPALQLPGT
ncbi:MAG: helix-turn-helix transcriptional regulator [Candidatus Limnocylindrales bacterium]